MPQMYAHRINQSTRLALWHITEPESFFQQILPGKQIRHPHKRLQHLCGRYLLTHLAPGILLANIVAEQNNKPFLPGHPYHFSVSHSDDYAAAIVSEKGQVGIDVETTSLGVIKIRHKFLTETEEAMLQNHCRYLSELQRLTLAWSAKETLFKWLGESGVDFKLHLKLQQIILNGMDGLIVAKITRSFNREVEIGFRLINDVVLTWLET